MADDVRVEDIGYWSELKLEIIDKYARAYSRIVSPRFHHVYIDAFSGAGMSPRPDRPGTLSPGAR